MAAAQMQHAMSQNKLADLTYQQKQQQFDMIKPILARMGGGGQVGAQAASGAGGNMLTGMAPGSNPQGIPTDDGIPYSLQDLSMLAAAGHPGAKEMLEVKKAAMQGVKFEPGASYNVGGKVFTVPQLDKGMRINAAGQVAWI